MTKNETLAEQLNTPLQVTDWHLFREKCFSNPSLFLNIGQIDALKNLVTVKAGTIPLAIDQLIRMNVAISLGIYIAPKVYDSVTLCAVACGLVPPEAHPSEEELFETLTGEMVKPYDPRVRMMNWLLRRWRDAEENTGFVDPVVFYGWCEENDFDSNYLRLIKEISGSGEGKVIGPLPIEEPMFSSKMI